MRAYIWMTMIILYLIQDCVSQKSYVFNLYISFLYNLLGPLFKFYMNFKILKRSVKVRPIKLNTQV